MGAAVSEPIQAISIWHFVFTMGVWLAFAMALYNAVIGVLGINAVKPNSTKWPNWVWIWLAIGLALSFTAAWQAATQLQQSDLGRRKADTQEEAAEKRETQISGDLNDVRNKLAGLEGAVAEIASAAKISTDKPLPEIVQAIIEKLPKPTVTIRGNSNATTVGGGQAAQQQTINAANGIGTIGGTLINPQVNNFAPPPAHLTYTENVLTPLNDHVKKLLEVHVRTDRGIPAAAIGFLFSAPFTFSQDFFNSHQPLLKSASIQQLSETTPLQTNGVPIPNSLGILVNAPASFDPGQELIVTVESENDIRTLQVQPITR